MEFSAAARADLLGIYGWIAEQAGDPTATRYLDALEKSCLSLEYGSERGHRRDDLLEGLRIMGFRRRTTIAFVVEEDRVVILRLFHGGQNWGDAALWPESQAPVASGKRNSRQ